MTGDHGFIGARVGGRDRAYRKTGCRRVEKDLNHPVGHSGPTGDWFEASRATLLQVHGAGESLREIANRNPAHSMMDASIASWRALCYISNVSPLVSSPGSWV